MKNVSPTQQLAICHSFHDRLLTGLVGAAICLSLCGCGDAEPRRVSVAGEVLVDGQPLDKGTVQFSPMDDSGPMVTVTVESGRFEAPEDIGPIAGTCVVDVLVFQDMGFDLDDDEAYAKAVVQSKRPLSPTPAKPPVFEDESQRTIDLEEDRDDLLLTLHTPRKKRTR